MHKKLLVPLVAVLLVAAAIAAWAALRAREQQAWTTSSPAALAELRLGIDAQRKFYWPEARSHFEKALELDPGFAAAALLLLHSGPGKERREQLLAQLAKVDRARLTAREAFLVDVRNDWSSDEVTPALRKVVADYVRAHPRDPYGLELQGNIFWSDRRWEDSERVYQRLLAVDPNWVTAQNRLGYLSMAQRRFAEAEDRFRTYRYVAPDQANPHDSLGELLVLVGRFDEAQAELEAALRIRPDFCTSYSDLVTAARLTGHPERVEGYLGRAARSGCSPRWLASARCDNRIWTLYLARDWRALAQLSHDPCVTGHHASVVLPHLGAVLSGDLQLAAEIEAFEAKQTNTTYMAMHNPVPPHVRAVREVASGDLPAALRDFAACDRLLEYRQLDDGVFKMYNRLQWAHALELAADRPAAERLLREVAGVNRAMAGLYAALPAPSLPPPKR